MLRLKESHEEAIRTIENFVNAGFILAVRTKDFEYEETEEKVINCKKALEVMKILRLLRFQYVVKSGGINPPEAISWIFILGTSPKGDISPQKLLEIKELLKGFGTFIWVQKSSVQTEQYLSYYDVIANSLNHR